MIRAAAPARRRCGEIDDLVHDILAAGGRPLSAYDIAAQASERTARIVPAQVYRTLARLLRQRRALRIEMLGAYVPCPTSADLCLVCLDCHGVQLIADEALRSIRNHAAGRRFRLAAAPVEASGLCDACARVKDTNDARRNAR
ncbi:transcriptional repressor [Sphingomonas sp. Leaf21]|uniref:transcriptional repressor n=1 Tax=Sphingomonas sp. Leaf21 TaxID=2876550 RepID=UPI001E3EA2E8|nr:transcriptional repressor [Sphingomonas sp. Leaf21]